VNLISIHKKKLCSTICNR